MNRNRQIFLILLNLWSGLLFGQKIYIGTPDEGMPSQIIHFKIDTLGLARVVVVDNNGFLDSPSGALNIKCQNKISALVSVDSLPISFKIKNEVFEVVEFNYSDLTMYVNCCSKPQQDQRVITIPTSINELNHVDQKAIKDILDSVLEEYIILGTLWSKFTEEEFREFLDLAKYANEMKTRIIIYSPDINFAAKNSKDFESNDLIFLHSTLELEKDLLVNYWPNFNLIKRESGEIILQDRLDKIYEYIKKYQ